MKQEERMTELSTEESEITTEEQTEEETETSVGTPEQAEKETETTKESEENKVESTTENTEPKETPQPVHTHSYDSGVITTQPTCTTPGIKTYSCSCGDSYTENLGYGAHDFSIPVYQTVHHDAQYDVIKRELPSQKVIICRCGAEFTTNEGYDNHVISQIDAEGPFTACGSSYDIEYRPGGVTYDYVEISPAYDSEEIVTYKCSVCGQTQ